MGSSPFGLKFRCCVSVGVAGWLDDHSWQPSLIDDKLFHVLTFRFPPVMDTSGHKDTAPSTSAFSAFHLPSDTPRAELMEMGRCLISCNRAKKSGVVE